jgi:dipeptidyl aminopeptidase/acylaminoacyl peptidase
MQMQRCGIAALSLAALVVAGTLQATLARAAASPSGPALAYVANGQVALIEAGTLTVAGTGENPTWAPNASALMFERADPMSGNAIVYLADQHGANSKVLVKQAYALVNPAWSPDSKYVLYTSIAPNTKPKGQVIQLQVNAVKVATGAVTPLGTFPFTGGCTVTATALQDTFAHAQGSYRGMPNTLLWAQPNLVMVQSSCTGQGLTMFDVGGKHLQTLSTWSGAVLSPNGKLIAANANGRPGIVTVATRASKVLPFKFAPASLAWDASSGTVFAVSQPANPANGKVSVYSFTPDGKTSLLLSTIAASGAFHLSINPPGDHLALALVANAPAKTVAPPSVMVYDVHAQVGSTPMPLVAGTQPAWRP